MDERGTDVYQGGDSGRRRGESLQRMTGRQRGALAGLGWHLRGINVGTGFH